MHQSAPPTNPVVLFLETGSPAKSLSTKTVIWSMCSCLRNGITAFWFLDKIPRCTPQRNNVEFLWFAHFSGPNVLLCPQGLICRGPKTTASYKQICIVLHVPSPELDSVYHQLVLQFLSWCANCLCVRVANRFLAGEWGVSQVTFDSQELSSLIYPNSEHTIQKTEDFSHQNLRIHVMPCLLLSMLIYDVSHCD